jgi:hypothetical protein
MLNDIIVLEIIYVYIIVTNITGFVMDEIPQTEWISNLNKIDEEFEEI